MTSLKTSIKTITYLSDIGCLEIQGASLNGTIASIIASQNLITMRTSGAGLTLLESQLQRLPDIEQTVIFGNQLYITSRDEAKLKSALFAFTQQGYEFCKVDTNLEDAFTYLMKNNCEKN
ncbi:putative ABC-type multidrug transport system, ATPase component [Klebsiella pneumoniae]|uniref:Putative ABC-type multidrug transport system, ATPase component n=1 Tax=Klebsiella pneumoniae TaxID=573 RepID=A0A377XA90_KLEPN|nr:putative ABC-type multidrug transport system, ATPase component [Klebsiella pneumoniae]STT82425.1 putative ABC-type multidrug transport system, ATPase component [Klebsiella pneumoniae]STU10006.1 putative ABC-type multidrug transport system, ATPase component [Klebsiella pneumoniae]STW10979.1 putative ABC-type multidrug transport system, ATPase component [Klebsiella pneumoniae subsp. rhinoscleromatis]VTT33306.1 putative ABC-type multidrug transport system, ATPase component [Klebsiella pneumonia